MEVAVVSGLTKRNCSIATGHAGSDDHDARAHRQTFSHERPDVQAVWVNEVESSMSNEPGHLRASEPYPPISTYALIGDCHGGALISLDGSIDWCCFHRVDASPVFARLLDWQKGGYWRIAPTTAYEAERRYHEGTNVLETRFETSEGVVVLTDCLVIPEGDHHPDHELIRTVRCEAGRVEVGSVFRPRFDYGLTVPRYEPRGERAGIAFGGADGLALCSDLELVPLGDCTAESQADLETGDEAFFSLTWSQAHELRPRSIGRAEAKQSVDRTVHWWKNWSSGCHYDGPYRDQVLRSALVLKALTNGPTGAIVAAPTTSLPEEIGGVRNWDYRYAWMRDAAINLYSLFQLGYTEEAHAFMDWVQRTTAGRSEDLQVLYGVAGARLISEVEIEQLDGYRGSRPVRIGNAAADQFQLDVYGYLLDTAWLYHRHGGKITMVFWEFLRGVIDVVRDRWELPDDGIWEVRGGRRHFVSSKVMAWVAVDRAIRLARARGLPADLASWKTLRAEIRRRVETEGVDPATGAFVQSFGSSALDASALLIPLVRFLPADDHRVRATMERVATELAPDGLVYRYLNADDGLTGQEATFVICSFWLVDNFALAGEIDRAQELLDRLLAFANDVGLLAEEIDPASRELLGNFPQAFSHVGLIGAVLNLARAREKFS
jgi:GH15 family glucan-1,4-alpha-glucosidase